MTLDNVPIIGRERFLTDQLTKRLHDEVRRHYDYARIRETRRGNTFEVMVADRSVIKVTVEFDRIEPIAPAGPEAVS